MSTINEEWIVIGRSIFCAKERIATSPFGHDYTYREAVSFNVGPTIAHHIVNLHNEDLKVRESRRVPATNQNYSVNCESAG